MRLRDEFPDGQLKIRDLTASLVLDHVGGGRGHVSEGRHEIAGGVHTDVAKTVGKEFGEAGESGVD